MSAASRDGLETCMRPALPPTLPCAAAVWAGAWLAGQGMPEDFPAGPVAVAGCMLVACALLLVLGRRASATLLAVLALACGAGAGSAWLHFAHQEAMGREALAEGPAAYAFVVQSDPRPSSYGDVSFKATAVPVRAGSDGTFEVWVSLKGEGVPCLGEVLTVKGFFSRLDESSDYERSRYLQGCALKLRASGAVSAGFQAGPVGAVRAFRADMLARLGDLGEAGPSLVAGVVFGDQAAVSSSGVSDTFSKLGISHIIAVSGSHLALVAALGSRLVRRARLRPCVATPLLLGLLGVYVCLTGFQVSALRAFVMSAVALGAGAAHRRAQGLSSVCVAVVCLVLAWPSCAFSLGFQLSVASVVALVAFGGFVQSWFCALLPRRAPEALTSTLSLTALAQLATAPLTLPVFGTVPVFALVANAVFVPAVGAVVTAGVVWCVLGLCMPAPAALLLGPIEAASTWLCAAACWLAGLGPVAPVVDVGAAPLWVACAVSAGLLYLFWPRPTRRRARCAAAAAVGACAVVLGVALLVPVERMVVLDVGQGDAILLQASGRAVLVDTGPDESVVRALARQHVWRLDAVVLTHTDLDHVGGLAELVGHVGVGQVVFARGVPEDLERQSSALLGTIEEGLRAQVVEAGAGDVIRAGDMSLEVLWPRGPVAGDENADSLVAVATWGAPGGDGGAAGQAAMRALLTGDAESDVVGPLVEQGLAGRIDVLKVAHHGSAVSTTPEMVRALSVAVGVASAGADNPYGHPRPECVEAVEESGAVFVCTAQAGDVAFYPSGGAIRMRCSRDAPLGDS